MGSDSETFLVLVGGGHSAGKKTICEAISTTISPVAPVKIIEFDKYLNNSDNDVDVLNTAAGPQRYDFVKLLREINCEHEGKLVVLVHGLYALYDKGLCSKAIMKVFVDCDQDVRLSRMVSEEVLHGSKKLGDVLDLYLTQLRSEFNDYILPTKNIADVLLPSEHPKTGVKLICDGISALLKGEGAQSTVTELLYPRVKSDTLLSEGKYDQNRFYDLS